MHTVPRKIADVAIDPARRRKRWQIARARLQQRRACLVEPGGALCKIAVPANGLFDETGQQWIVQQRPVLGDIGLCNIYRRGCRTGADGDRQQGDEHTAPPNRIARHAVCPVHFTPNLQVTV